MISSKSAEHPERILKGNNMFSKHNNFFFKEPLQKQDSESLTTDYAHTVQLIFCGSLAQNVINALDPKITVDVAEDLHALQYCTTGKITIDAKVNVYSDINYHETRKRKQKSIAFDHQDKVLKSQTSSNAATHFFAKSDPNFKSDLQTYLVIAAEDKAEIDNNLKALHATIANQDRHGIIKCMVMSKDWNVLWRGDSNWPMDFCKVDKENATSDFAKHLKNELKENSHKYIKNIEQELYDKIYEKIINEFKNTVLDKADQFFNEHKRKCSIV